MVKLAPVLRDYLWGGRRLREQFGKACSGSLAESWELSVHREGSSIVSTGPDAGTALDVYLTKHGAGYIGSRAARFPFFPAMVKLIDARDALSIQVHPSDQYALSREGQYGKTEVWYIVDALPGAYIYYGLNRAVTTNELRGHIEAGTLPEILNRVEVQAGEVYFIPAGTIHAIGAGVLVCEIQQNSNVTYRIYDYERRGPDGKLRELHVEKALEVASLEQLILPPQTCTKDDGSDQILSPIASCPYFTAVHGRAAGKFTLDTTKESFTHLLFLAGQGELTWGSQWLDYKKGDSILIPAGAGTVTLFRGGEFVITTV